MNCTVAEVVTSDDLGGADEVTIKMGGGGGRGGINTTIMDDCTESRLIQPYGEMCFREKTLRR